MYARSLLLVGLSFGLIACQENQDNPFGSNSDPVSKTIDTGGGLLSSPAGASVAFGSGSLPAPTQVTLRPVAPTVPSGGGSAVGTLAFQLEPVGMVLGTPAIMEIVVPGTTALPFPVGFVNVAGSQVAEIGLVDADRTNGALRGPIQMLGTITPVSPEPAAAITLTQGVATSQNVALAAAGASALVDGTFALDCGGISNRCPITASVTAGLLQQVRGAALLYPMINGSFTLAGETASGSLTVRTAVVLSVGNLQSATAATATAATTPATRAVQNGSAVTLTNMAITGTFGTRSTTITRDLQLAVQADGSLRILAFEAVDVALNGADYAVSLSLPLNRR